MGVGRMLPAPRCLVTMGALGPPPPHRPHRRPSTLSPSPPAPPPSLASRHVGVREGKGFVEAGGSRSGRNPKCSEQGGSISRPGGGGAHDRAARACSGLTGPWSNLARRAPPSSPHSISAPESELGALRLDVPVEEWLSPGGKAPNPPF